MNLFFITSISAAKPAVALKMREAKIVCFFNVHIGDLVRAM
jgi:hypothetical protein